MDKRNYLQEGFLLSQIKKESSLVSCPFIQLTQGSESMRCQADTTGCENANETFLCSWINHLEDFLVRIFLPNHAALKIQMERAPPLASTTVEFSLNQMKESIRYRVV